MIKSYRNALLDAVKAQIPTFGRILVVMPAADYDKLSYKNAANTFLPDADGRVRFFNTPEAAYAEARTNENDVICLDGNATHVLSSMLIVSKNRVHFLGFDGGGRVNGQGAKVSIGVTTAVTDLAPVLVTGVRNTFRNIKFINGNTNNNCLYGFIDNGEATFIENCSFMKIAGLDDANHAHFWMASDSGNYKNITIGQSNIPSSAAGFGILIDGKTGGATDGTVKENILENIYINMSVANGVVGTSCFIKIADNAALNFGNIVNGITASNYIPSGAAALTDAILGANGTVAGVLNIKNAAWFGCTGVGAGATQGVNVAQSTAPDADGGLATAVTD